MITAHHHARVCASAVCAGVRTLYVYVRIIGAYALARYLPTANALKTHRPTMRTYTHVLMHDDGGNHNELRYAKQNGNNARV